MKIIGIGSKPKILLLTIFTFFSSISIFFESKEEEEEDSFNISSEIKNPNKAEGLKYNPI